MSIDDELRQDEQRITRKLLALAGDALADDTGSSLPKYLRRHLPEHAHAAAALDGRILDPRLLPHLDATRLRQIAAGGGPPPGSAPGLWSALRHVTHLWDFNDPAFNAAALEMRTAAQGEPLSGAGTQTPWRVHWAHWTLDQSEILARYPERVFSVATALLPDGRALAVTVSGGGIDRTLRVWDLVTGEPVGDPLTGPLGPVATAVLPDGRALAVTGGAQGRVWELLTGEPVGVPLSGQIGAVATAVLPDGRAFALTGGRNGTVRLWDLHTGAPVGIPLTAHADRVEKVVTKVLPDNSAVAVTEARDGSLRWWDLSAGELASIPTNSPRNTNALATATLPDGRVVDVFGGLSAGVWQLAIGEPVRRLRATSRIDRVFAVATAVLSDGRTVAVTGGRDGMVRVWDLVTEEPAGTEQYGRIGSSGPVATAVLPDGRVVGVTAGSDGEVWDLRTGETVSVLQTGRTGPVGPVATAVLPDGRVVLVGCPGTYFDRPTRVWDMVTGEPLGELLTERSGDMEMLATAVLPDGRAVAVGVPHFGHAVRVWDLGTGEPVGELLIDDTDSFEALTTASLPDGRAVAVGATRGGTRTVTDHVAGTVTVTNFEAKVGMWDLATGEPVGAPLPQSIGPVATAVLSDGRAVAVTGSRDGRAWVWDLTTSDPVGFPLTGQPGMAVALATTTLPDGRAVAVTLGWEGTVRVSDLATGQPIGPELPTVGIVYALTTAHLADGSCAILFSGDGVAMATFQPAEW
jgi:WD40 repeat protein